MIRRIPSEYKERSPIPDGSKEHQQIVLGRWVSYQIMKSGKEIRNFATDFSDGVVLCLLVEALTGETVTPKVNRSPTTLKQRQANIEAVFKFLESKHPDFKGRLTARVKDVS